MKITKSQSALLTVALLVSATTSAHAYGPEGLFGGRAAPDGSIVLVDPVSLRNDRPERAESVLEHPRPDFDAAPIEVGSFELYPTLELGETYDSNIYASPDTERGDAIATFRPIVNLFSNWNRHAISVTTFGDVNYYSQHPDENYNNAVFDITGRYDIMNQTWMSARGGYQRLAETRTSPNAANGAEPTTFGYGKTGLTAYRGVGKIKVNADYDYHRFDYDDTKTDTVDIDQSGRNRNEHIAGGKVAYDVTGNLKAYLRGDYNWRMYDHNSEQKDSDGFTTLAGVQADLGGITSVDFYAGYMEQYYEDSTKKTLRSPRIGTRVDWNVTGMTSVVLEADRTLEEAAFDNYSSYYQTGGSVTVTHELLRNVLLEASAGYSNSDFNGGDGREDDTWFAGIGGRYMINRSLYTDLFYNWDQRDSTDDAVDYSRNMISLRLGIRY